LPLDERWGSRQERIINQPENNKLILSDEEKFQDRLQTRLLVVQEVDTGVTL